MAEVARRHGLDVEEATFESWAPRGRAFDLLVSGQAWHWVDPEEGARKAAAVLRPAATIGLFWNQGRPDGDIGAALDEVYERMAPGLEAYSVLLRPLGRERFEAAGAALSATGAFGEARITAHAWARTYTRTEWVDHLMTHSDHRTMPPAPRAALVREIRAVIDAFGGSLRVDYTCWLVAGRRLSPSG
jgi:hypothetical protein